MRGLSTSFLGDHARPDGVAFGKYLSFLLDAAVCKVFGHRDPVVMTMQEPRGRLTRYVRREACSRCGHVFEETSSTTQMPRRAAEETGIWRVT